MISVQAMKILEENSEHYKVSKAMLMEQAGKAFVTELKKRYSFRGKRVLVACYHGNNGGDGFVIARLLTRYAKVTVLFLGDEEKFSKESKQNFRELPSAVDVVQDLEDVIKPDLIIDALLGTGGQGPLKEPLSSTVKYMNSSKAAVVSVDVPTGVSPETGQTTTPYVKPKSIITFHDVKTGLQNFLDKSKIPFSIADIGIPAKAELEVGKGDAMAALAPRAIANKKGDAGKVLVIGGSEDFSGAPTLAVLALAALRSGTDLVRVMAPSRVSWAINAFTPDVITTKLPGTHISTEHYETLKEGVQWADVILIGPGLGRALETEKVLTRLLKTKKAKVLDADALKMVQFDSVINTIMTPHTGEFSILWERTFGRKSDKLTSMGLKKLQVVLESNVVVLKGATDKIISARQYKENKTGDIGMTVGGTGDVLAGMTAGLLAICDDLFLAACAAAWIVGKAGEECRKEMGYSYLASDLLDKIPAVISSLVN